MWSDHILNDIKWLRANTFSWQDGTVYNAVYTHLLNDITPVNTDLVYNPTIYSIIDQRPSFRVGRKALKNSTYNYTENGTTYYAWAYGNSVNTFGILIDGWFTTSETPQANDTIYVADIDDLVDGVQATSYTLGVSNQIDCDNIEDVHFPVYYKADDGHKICLDDSYVSGVYMYLMPDNPIAWYFVLDTANQRFKLPYVTNNNRIVIKEISGTNNRWARIYNDGWVEQGGLTNTTDARVLVSLLFPFNDDNYLAVTSESTTATNQNAHLVAIHSKTLTSFEIRRGDSAVYTVAWEAKGYSDNVYTLLQGIETQYKSKEKYLYFYVGNYAEQAIEQTAGLNTELLNDKADTDLSNVLANIDYVIESKLPTAQDLTWYRVWKSGWVEQGGRYTLTNQGSGQGETIALPKEMADTNYIVLCGPVSNTDNWPLAWCPLQHRTTTTINLDGTGNYTGAYRTITIEWEVKGQGA